MEDGEDLAGWLPRLVLQDTDADRPLFIEGDVGMPYPGNEVDDRGLEGIFGGEIDEELEFAALDT